MLSSKVTFVVSEIGYDEERNINSLTIVDGSGKVRYKLGQQAPKVVTTKVTAEDEEALNAFAIPAIQQAQTTDDLMKVWNDYPSLQGDERFKSALNQRKRIIQAA